MCLCHYALLVQFVDVVKNKLTDVLKKGENEELLLIQDKLDDLIKMLGDDCICVDHFYIKLDNLCNWFQDIIEDTTG